MRDHWKLIVTIVIVAGALALVGLRVKRSFAPQAPASLNYEQHTSPGLLLNGDLRRAWKSIEPLVTRARQEERAALLRLANISFLHICKLPNEALVWDTVEMHNPGFEPLHRAERIEPSKPAILIGYYTLDGKPLAYDTKTDLRNKQQTLTTVDLAEPLAAGKSVLFFRVLRVTDRVSTNQPGHYVVNLGHLPVSTSQFHATGFSVSAPAVLEKYIPADGLVHDADGIHVVSWLSSRSDAPARNVQVTFTVPK